MDENTFLWVMCTLAIAAVFSIAGFLHEWYHAEVEYYTFIKQERERIYGPTSYRGHN